MSERHSERNIWLEALLPDVYCNRINSKSSEPIDHLLLQDECCFCSEKINGFKISSRSDSTDNPSFCTKCLLLLEENYKQLMNETENQNYYNEMVSSEYSITFVFPKSLSVADVFFGNKWETKPELKDHLLEEDEEAANETLTTTFSFNSEEIVPENGDTTETERQREPDIVDINEQDKGRTLQIKIRKRAPARLKKCERTQTSVRNDVSNKKKDKQFDFREHLFEKANEASITTLSLNSEEVHTTEPLLENTENMDIERDHKPDTVNTTNQDNSRTLQLEIRKPKLDRLTESLRTQTRNKEEKCDLRQHLMEDANETSITTLSIKSEEIHITESPMENDDNMNTESEHEPNIADINEQDNSRTVQFEIRKPALVRSAKSKRTSNVENDVVNSNRDKCDSNQLLLEDANEASLTTLSFKSEEIHISENEENMDTEWQCEPDIVDIHQQNISETIQFKIRKPAPARSKEKVKNKNEGYVCRICATLFSDRGERGTHERNQHRSRTTRLYQCTNCDFSRKHVRNMEYHCRTSKCIKKKPKQKKTFCRLCKLSFDTNEQRSQHKFAAHLNKTTNLCNDCSYSHKNVENSEQHAYHSHKRAAKTKCRICNEEGFATQPLRNIHEMEAHMDHTTSTYLCPQCNTKFSDKNEFIYHLRVHNGEKLFVCNICGKSFGFSCYLDQHMIVHKETKEFECDICGKNFSTKIRIKAHLNTHSDNKQYKCDQCDKSYRGRTDLRRHKYTHEGIQPRFTCNICEKKFFEPSFLKVHMKIHT